MLESKTKIRVRYGETDQMGYAYYGIYAQYYEVGRVEAIRKLGFSYKDVEAKGIMLPVVDFSINYKKPAYYDDEITLITRIKVMPENFRIFFDYECLNDAGQVLNTGKVTLVTVDKKTGKVCQMPDWFRSPLAAFFT